MGSNATRTTSQDTVMNIVTASQLRAHHFEAFMHATSNSCFLALSAAYGARRRLEWIALVHDSHQALVIKLDFPSNQKSRYSILNNFMDTFTRQSSMKFIAYSADVLAAGLFLDCGIRLKHCIDIHSINEDGDKASFSYTRNTVRAISDETLTYSEYCSLFDDRAKSPDHLDHLVGRGTMALMIGARLAGEIPRKAKINTGPLSGEASSAVRPASASAEPCAPYDQVVVLIAQLLRDADCIEALKPMVKKHGLASGSITPNGDLALVSSRFKTRIRRHQGQQVYVTFPSQ